MRKRRKQSGESARFRRQSAKQVLRITVGDPARIDLLFTMSEISQAAALVKPCCMQSDVSRTIV
jgi:hypothetical protein